MNRRQFLSFLGLAPVAALASKVELPEAVQLEPAVERGRESFKALVTEMPQWAIDYGYVNKIIFQHNGNIYIGGNFTHAEPSKIGSWNAETWQSLNNLAVDIDRPA